MCNYSARIPKYPNTESLPLKAMTVRISEKQRANIDRIVEATNAPSIGASVRLLITEEMTAVNKGQRQPADYIPTDEPKLYTVGLKVSNTGRSDLEHLRMFYHAPSLSDTVCHLMNSVIRELEKAGE